MCGIVGYVGYRPVADFLLEGLHRLEYRGYDSAGIAVMHSSGITVRKRAGRVGELGRLVETQPVEGTIGIGHTRWATHGETTDENSHPHLGGNGEVAIVHNGVIENYDALRTQLTELGYVFHSQTDTEVAAHLIAHHLAEQLKIGSGEPASLDRLNGTYGLAAVFRDCPDTIIAARSGSPLVIGVGQDEYFLASDASPLIGYTKDVVYLADNEVAVLTTSGMKITHRTTGSVQPSIQTLDQVSADIDKGDYPHYMLKEIFEQPQTIENALRGRLDEAEATAQLRTIDRVVLTACGTSWHAGLVGEYLLEEFARLPTEVEYASELRYRNPPISDRTLVFAITQSGETADTLAAMRECRRKGHPTLALCNVVGSTIAREADGGIYLHAGSEIGVASTKAFTSQVTVLTLLALYLGKRIIKQLREMPQKVEEALKCHERVQEIAEKYSKFNNFLYLGRLYNFPVALEGALKLKEISYIHAEGYPAAEMKHGPIALVDEQTPSVFIVPRGGIQPKVISNMEEVKARKGPVIAIACEGDEEVARIADDVIFVPDVEDYLQPLVCAIPLQLLSYHVALLRGCNVDRPRNLAKSVTVE
ncbi:UNVERIFIED_CONTAM: hypothetical protein GTU68_053187 [Idotea baltica]|nr:hypothetical protein [Idotea baltica]